MAPNFLWGCFALLILTASAQVSFAQWQPHYVKQGDGAGGVVYYNAQTQIVGKPLTSPSGGGTPVETRPFGLVEMSNGQIAMTSDLRTSLTAGEQMISFSSDGGNNWSAWQSIASDGGGPTFLTDHGGPALSVANPIGKRFSNDFGQTWGAPVAMPNTSTGFGWSAEGNAGVDRDLGGNATKIMEIGYGQGAASLPSAFTSFYRESVDGGLTWTGAGGVGVDTNPGASWQFTSLGANSQPSTRGTSEGSIVRADNGDLVAALRTDMPAVYFDNLNGPNVLVDTLEGTAISTSSDNGATWSNLDILYDAGRHHGNLQKMANGDLVLTLINRTDIRGTVFGTSADLTTNMRGADMLISHDNGQTWNLDERITLREVERLSSDPSQWHDGHTGHLATAALNDGSLLTAYGDYLSDNGVAGAALVKWDPSDPTVLPVMNWGIKNSGSWSKQTNWSPQLIPADKLSTARFGSNISSPQTVIANESMTVRGIEFDSSHTYAVAGLGSVDLDGDTGAASILSIQGSHQFQVVVNLNSDAVFNAAPTTEIDFNNAVNMNGHDLVLTGGGTIDINNALNTGGGTVSVLAGVVAGSGQIVGNLENISGTVSPGNSPGTLTVVGNYTQESAGTLAIELAGLVPGDDYDQLEVTGNLAIHGGTLEVSLIGEFQPSAGDVFDILDFSSTSGVGFDLVSLPPLDQGFAWDTSGLLASGTLSISAVPEPSSLALFMLAAIGMRLAVGRSSPVRSRNRFC